MKPLGFLQNKLVARSGRKAFRATLFSVALLTGAETSALTSLDSQRFGSLSNQQQSLQTPHNDWLSLDYLECADEASSFGFLATISNQGLSFLGMNQNGSARAYKRTAVTRHFGTSRRTKNPDSPQPESIAFAALALLTLSLIARRTIRSRT